MVGISVTAVVHKVFMLQYAALWCTNGVTNMSHFNALVLIKDPTQM